MSVEVRWMWAFVDAPRAAAAASWSFWSSVTRSRLSATRGETGEFATLVPERGDPWLKVQALTDGRPRVHLDLDVDDPQSAAAEAVRLGAQIVADHGYVVMASPGGLVFCFTSHHGEERQVRDGEPDLLDQVCLDCPADRWDDEVAFWGRLTGWPHHETDPPEFSYLERPGGMPLRILVQRLEEESGAVRAHPDLACRSRAQTQKRHVALGARVVDERSFWTVLRDPAGMPYCLTDRTPTQTWVSDAQG